MKIKKTLFLAILAALIVFLNGCAARGGGRWVVAAVRSIAPTPNTIAVINNMTDAYFEVRINGDPMVATNTATKETKLALIPPRGTGAPGWPAFLRDFEVSVTVVSHCLRDSPASCVSGRMTSREFHVSANGTYQRVETWNISPHELR